MKKRSQISVEFVMIIAIGLIIILPGIYLFRNYVFESNDALLKSRVTEISTQILSKARVMYYYGPPSKTTYEIEMPPQVNNMYLLSVPDNNEYYLVINILASTGPEDLYYESEIPLKAQENITCNIACQGNCDCFPARYFSKGVKNYKIEATQNCNLEEYCIIIGEISPELV